ncbi:hypothetical protein KKB99_06310 [bacterium]|nr:hypothetical protein [bacterium]MBU1025601.1 hypothetical protein [bacterium]
MVKNLSFPWERRISSGEKGVLAFSMPGAVHKKVRDLVGDVTDYRIPTSSPNKSFAALRMTKSPSPDFRRGVRGEVSLSPIFMEI